MQTLSLRAVLCRQAATALVCWLSAAGVLQARVIDDFDVGAFDLVGANATVHQTQSGLDPARVVGGSRYLSFRSFALPPSALSLAGPEGTLDVSPGGCCTYLTVRYGDTANPLNLDLWADGSDRFVVTVTRLTTEISGQLAPNHGSRWPGPPGGDRHR